MEPAGDVVEDLGLIGSKWMQSATTGRAATALIAWWRVFDDRAWQRRWERCADRLGAILGVSFRLGRRIRLGGLFFLIGEQKFQLFDVIPAALCIDSSVIWIGSTGCDSKPVQDKEPEHDSGHQAERSLGVCPQTGGGAV
jgi:hypothetical protein